MRASDYPTVDTPEFLLAALEQASEAVVIIDSDLRVSHFNAAAESIWGVAREDILGLDASCLGLTDLQRRVLKSPSGAPMAAGFGQPYRPRRVEIGGRSSYMVFVRDITAEVERRERIALLNLVADKTNRAVVVTDRNLRVVYTNAAFSGMFGYSPEEAQGRQANQLLAGPVYRPQDPAPGCAAGSAMDSGDEEEILAYDKNGDEIWVSATVKAFRNDRGRIKYIFALLSDISETKQLRSLQQLIMGALADELPTHRDCRPALPAGRNHRARCRRFAAAHRLRRTVHPLGGPSLPEDYSRALDGVAIGPDIGSCGSAAYYGKAVLATDHRHRPALAAVQGAAARGRPEGLLVDADQGQGRPRDRDLRLLFQGMPRAEPLASADRRRLRSPRCAGDRAQGSPRPDRPARLSRHADRAAEPRAVASS